MDGRNRIADPAGDEAKAEENHVDLRVTEVLHLTRRVYELLCIAETSAQRYQEARRNLERLEAVLAQKQGG